MGLRGVMGALLQLLKNVSATKLPSRLMTPPAPTAAAAAAAALAPGTLLLNEPVRLMPCTAAMDARLLPVCTGLPRKSGSSASSAAGLRPPALGQLPITASSCWEPLRPCMPCIVSGLGLAVPESGTSLSRSSSRPICAGSHMPSTPCSCWPTAPRSTHAARILSRPAPWPRASKHLPLSIILSSAGSAVCRSSDALPARLAASMLRLSEAPCPCSSDWPCCGSWKNAPPAPRASIPGDHPWRGLAATGLCCVCCRGKHNGGLGREAAGRRHLLCYRMNRSDQRAACNDVGAARGPDRIPARPLWISGRAVWARAGGVCTVTGGRL
ncbi:MAG: hypothetical protein J3K34DRAFT_429779 [Monoraphidium minutum]|nr:MAG: hypothetical protein J3K34DRAFT_429779 [Monoraphidium minutum]